MTLRCAAYGGDADQVKQLLAKGAPVDKTDARGMTPLHYASDQNHPAVVPPVHTPAYTNLGVRSIIHIFWCTCMIVMV